MKTFAYGLAAAVAVVLFTVFGSVGTVATPSVTTHVSSMYAVLPDGALAALQPSTLTQSASLPE